MIFAKTFGPDNMYALPPADTRRRITRVPAGGGTDGPAAGDDAANGRAGDVSGGAVRRRLRPRDEQGRAGPERPAKRPRRCDPEPQTGKF